MSNKDFENFMKTGSIKDYLKYKKQKQQEEKNDKRRDSNKGNRLS